MLCTKENDMREKVHDLFLQVHLPPSLQEPPQWAWRSGWTAWDDCGKSEHFGRSRALESHQTTQRWSAQGLFFFEFSQLSDGVIRVLLVKRPNMMVPTFFEQYQFVCNIKSTYQVDMPGTKNFDVGANTVPWGVISVLGPRQKWVNVPPTFFQLFINFLIDFYLLYNI